jgi:hypothetical protein
MSGFSLCPKGNCICQWDLPYVPEHTCVSAAEARAFWAIEEEKKRKRRDEEKLKEMKRQEKLRKKRDRILSKLTPNERRILGL